MREFSDLFTILNAKGATGVGNSFLVEDYKTVVVQLTFVSATLTVKCAGSISDSAPDFSAAQSLTNHWDYVDMIGLMDNAAVTGDTGVASTGASSDCLNFEVNVNGLKWLNFVVTSFTAGSVTIKVKGFNE